ncbi:hypothetical protein, partial [Corynebacterium vitaeruminis]|uniref:hypothetical protein n=1 Tax=Corynebacterium vitaeruminis TaxID=38305 RepID=UPI0023F53BB0
MRRLRLGEQRALAFRAGLRRGERRLEARQLLGGRLLAEAARLRLGGGNGCLRLGERGLGVGETLGR